MITYVSSAGDDNIISTSGAILERIIVGKDVASSVIKVSNSSTTGDADVQIQLEGDSLRRSYAINAEFTKGITADLTNQTNVTFIWHPISV